MVRCNIDSTCADGLTCHYMKGNYRCSAGASCTCSLRVQESIFKYDVYESVLSVYLFDDTLVLSIKDTTLSDTEITIADVGLEFGDLNLVFNLYSITIGKITIYTEGGNRVNKR